MTRDHPVTAIVTLVAQVVIIIFIAALIALITAKYKEKVNLTQTPWVLELPHVKKSQRTL